MSYLPPVGWANVATKQDLALMSAEIRGEVGSKIAALDGKIGGFDDKIDARIEGLRAEMERGFSRQTRWMVTTYVALTGVFAVIVNWLG